MVISGLGQGLVDSRGSHQGLLKTELIHARALLEGSDPQSSRGSKGGGWGVTPYSVRSSLHSTSGPALMGLVHFCCMGLSSSATQHTSPVPVGNRKFENAQFQAERPLRSREATPLAGGGGARSTCNHSLGSPPEASGSHLPAHVPGEMLEAALGITG